MLGFAPLGAKSLGEYAATVAPTAPTFTADLALSGTGFDQALADTLTGSTANTTTPGELTGTGVRLTLSQSLTSQVD